MNMLKNSYPKILTKKWIRSREIICIRKNIKLFRAKTYPPLLPHMHHHLNYKHPQQVKINHYHNQFQS